MRIRPPDIFVITERGKYPAFLRGEYKGGLLIACFFDYSIFLINPVSLKLVTFAGTELDLEFEKCDTEVWSCFDE